MVTSLLHPYRSDCNPPDLTTGCACASATVRTLTAVCFVDIFRIFAPDPPFKPEQLVVSVPGMDCVESSE